MALLGDLQDFQRNTAFVVFVGLIGTASFVYLTSTFRETLIPLVWSAFFAMPFTLLISSIENMFVVATSRGLGLVRTAWGLPARSIATAEVVTFRARAGENRIYLRNTPAVKALVDSCNNPCNTSCGVSWMSGWGRRRLRVIDLQLISQQGEVEDDLGPEVNRLVEGWSYFIKEAPPITASGMDTFLGNVNDSEAGPVDADQVLPVEFHVDVAGEYPAVVGPIQPEKHFRGKLEVVKASSLSWAVSFFITLLLMSAFVCIFVVLLTNGINAVSSQYKNYEAGFSDLIDKIKPMLPKQVYDWAVKAQKYLSDELPTLVSSLVSTLESVGFQAVLFWIYLLFWVFEPLPVNHSVTRLFKSYLFLKTLVCLLFAGLMTLLLYFLECQLWPLFFIITFLLNYLPEVGAILSAILTVPAVLFDGSVKSFEIRLWHTMWLAIFGLLIKFVTGNIVEVRLYAKSGGQFMRMHPVILMFMLMVFYALLGVTGMFLAVPIMSAVKYYMLSMDLPHVYSDPLLVMIEGDAAGPHKNYIEQTRAEEKKVPEEHDVEAILSNSSFTIPDQHQAQPASPADNSQAIGSEASRTGGDAARSSVEMQRGEVFAQRAEPQRQQQDVPLLQDGGGIDGDHHS